MSGGPIVKSLVFVADRVPFLALTSGSNRADPARLAELLGTGEVRRATAEEARAATGFAIGGTPPFGHPSPLRVLVDEDLLGYDVIWAARGTPDTVFASFPSSSSDVWAGAARLGSRQTPAGRSSRHLEAPRGGRGVLVAPRVHGRHREHVVAAPREPYETIPESHARLLDWFPGPFRVHRNVVVLACEK